VLNLIKIIEGSPYDVNETTRTSFPLNCVGCKDKNLGMVGETVIIQRIVYAVNFSAAEVRKRMEALFPKDPEWKIFRPFCDHPEMIDEEEA